MSPLLANGVTLFSFLPPPTPHSSRCHHRLPPLLVSAWPFGKKNSIPFIGNYLAVAADSFCSSSDEALQASSADIEDLAGIEFPDRLDSVIQLLKDVGLSVSRLKTLTLIDPLLLFYTENFKLRVREVADAGFSKEIILLLIQVNPTALAMKNPMPWLLFWRQFLGNNHRLLMRVIRRNKLLFNFNKEEYVEPRLNLIREYGLPDQQITFLLLRVSGLMLWSLDYLRWVFGKTKDLGFQPGSKMFLDGVIVVGRCTETKFNQRIEFLMNFGWSKDKVYSAVKRYPSILRHNEERMKYHIDFLVGKVGFDLETIAFHPNLLGYSIEKRLIPRHYVLTTLKAHGVKKDYKLYNACRISEELFLAQCVTPYEKDVPGLREGYAAACSGKEIVFSASGLPSFVDTPSNPPLEKKNVIPFIDNYLVNPSEAALNISAGTDLAGIKFSDQLNLFIQLLKEIGLSDSQVDTITSFDPLLESYTETFKLRVCEIVDAGFSKEVILLLIKINPRTLAEKNPLPWLLFWRDFLGNNNKVLIKVIRKNWLLFNFNKEEYVEPRLNLIRKYSLSYQQIASLLMRISGLMLWSLDDLTWVFEKTTELGLKPGSRMFLLGIKAVGSCTEIKFNQRIEFLMKLGWSKDQVYSAFRKCPLIIMHSEEGLKSHMDFLIGTAMLDLQSIVSDPTLLGYSINRTLFPRHHVLTILEAHGMKKVYKLHTACKLSEEKFLEKCVVPHEKDVPGLRETYAAACSGKVQL
jgi:mTERF domain-containing protein, mitochondrial